MDGGGKIISPENYEGGNVIEIASNSRNYKLALKSDSTLAYFAGAEPIRNELNELVKDVKGIVDIDASHYHFFALTEEGKVFGWQAENNVEDDDGRLIDHTGHGGTVKIYRWEEGEVRRVKRIWAAGDRCVVALDQTGKLHATARDWAGVNFVEKIKALNGFKDLAIMDVKFGDGASMKKGTVALWIE